MHQGLRVASTSRGQGKRAGVVLSRCGCLSDDQTITEVSRSAMLVFSCPEICSPGWTLRPPDGAGAQPHGPFTLTLHFPDHGLAGVRVRHALWSTHPTRSH